jgi:acetyl-CoA carboxylase biotin carboxyl carrier protein
MGLSYDEISEILKLIDGSSCDEFVLETEDIKLVVRRRSKNGLASSVDVARSQSVQSSAAALPPVQSATPASTITEPVVPPTPRSVPSAAERAGLHVVPAPMVGTFYRSPSPGAPPFVEVGSKVAKGDPLCIIEVMKLFTTIHAEIHGIIAEIGADDATLVEYGQMLFVMTPANVTTKITPETRQQKSRNVTSKRRKPR